MEPTWTEFWFEKCLEIISIYRNSRFDPRYELRDALTKLSGNENLTLELVLRHRDLPWDFDVLSANQSITPAIVSANQELPWNYNVLCGNSTFKWDDIVPLLPRLRNSRQLAKNQNVTTKEQFFQALSAIRTSDIPDEWALKPFVTVEFLRRYTGIFTVEQWTYISQNPTITWHTVISNPDLPWCFGGLSKNPNITAEILLANKERPWKLGKGVFPSVPPSVILEWCGDYYGGQRIWTFLTQHPLLTIDLIEEHWDELKNDADKIISNPVLSRHAVDRVLSLAAATPYFPLSFSARVLSRHATLEEFMQLLACSRSDKFTAMKFLSNPFPVAQEEFMAARRARLISYAD